jgi:hypothetical protein
MLDVTARERPLMMFCDLHGHSNKKNMFVYGCAAEYWRQQVMCCLKTQPIFSNFSAGWRGARASERKRVPLVAVLPLRFLPLQQMQLQARSAARVASSLTRVQREKRQGGHWQSCDVAADPGNQRIHDGGVFQWC